MRKSDIPSAENRQTLRSKSTIAPCSDKVFRIVSFSTITPTFSRIHSAPSTMAVASFSFRRPPSRINSIEALLSYSFTLPRTIPIMKCRCRKGYRSSIGKAPMTTWADFTVWSLTYCRSLAFGRVMTSMFVD